MESEVDCSVFLRLGQDVCAKDEEKVLMLHIQLVKHGVAFIVKSLEKQCT